MPQLIDLYKAHTGKDIYIIGTGPSLKLFPLAWLKDKITIGLNQAYKLFSPTYSLTIHPYLIPIERKKWDTKWLTKTKLSDESWKYHLNNGNVEKFYLFNNNNNPLNFDYLYPNKRPKNGLYVGCGIHTGAMHLACLMGAKSVYLIGCDFDYHEKTFHANNQHIELHQYSPSEVFQEYYYYAEKVQRELELLYKCSIFALSHILGNSIYTEKTLKKAGHLAQEPPKIIENVKRTTPLTRDFIQ